ncbi:hypothetical protein HMPREF9154_1249 [Arachnia propionica F0230a]|nr:hypothetical protein HMPREF9154_1249 [Arachnia propionica F0230a]
MKQVVSAQRLRQVSSLDAIPQGHLTAGSLRGSTGVNRG